MFHPKSGSRPWRLVLFLTLAFPVGALAQTAANVAVVINENSPASVRIGEHYAAKRGLPPENVLRVKTVTDDNIRREVFAVDIEATLANLLIKSSLQDRVLFLVLTKGVPLRIVGTLGQNGTTASVDSELSLLYRRMTGRVVLPAGPVDNPYFLGARALKDAKPFNRRDFDIYLVTRLDGFTVEDALALVDRGTAVSAEGVVILDQRAYPDSRLADEWMAEAARDIQSKNKDRKVVLEESRHAADPSDNVLGYFSWSSTDPALRKRPLDMRFVPGSIAATLVSSDARTMTAPPEGWQPIGDRIARQGWHAGSGQALIGDLIRAGVTGVAGTVAEPYLVSAIRPQILFPSYFAGFTLAEAFYLALPNLSWQTVIVGDPLCRPFAPDVPMPAVEAPPTDPATGVTTYFLNRRLDTLSIRRPEAPRDALVAIVNMEMATARSDNAAAKKALTSAIGMLPKDIELKLQLATLHELDNETKDAIELYRQVVEVDPRNVIALNNLAYGLATKVNDVQAAIPVARKAYAIAPDQPGVLDTLGWVEFLAGNHQEASKYAVLAAQRAPNHAEIRLHAAQILAKLGGKTEAAAHLAAAVKLNPALDSRDEVKELRRTLGLK